MDPKISLQQRPYELDDSVRSRAAIGLVVLATDHVIEHEFRKILNLPGVGLYQSRILNEPSINAETLSAMESRLEDSVRVILPGMPLDVIAYGCTSASMVIGPARVEALCQNAKPGVRVTNPFTAAVEALRRLDVSRMALLTPYRDELNLQMRGLFEKEGIEVPAMASFNVDDDNLVGRISPDSIKSAVLEIGGHPAVDAVFVACTNLRIAETIHSLEKQLGKPVTSSNHAMAWHALHLAGLSHSQKGWGRLFDQTW